MSLVKLNTDDDVANRIQDNVGAELARLDRKIDGGIVTAKLGVTAVSVSHGLGRKPLGREIVGQDADARIWDGPASATPKVTFTMLASATVTVKLRFF